MEHLASYFKSLSDESRLRILNLLFQRELCGCDIQHVLGASQSNVSRHLTYLKNVYLVSDRRVANRVYFSLSVHDDAERAELFSFLKSTFKKHPVFEADRKKLLAAIKDGDCSASVQPVIKASSEATKRNRAQRS